MMFYAITHHTVQQGLTIDNDARGLREAKRLTPTGFDIEILRTPWPPYHHHVMEALAAIDLVGNPSSLHF